MPRFAILRHDVPPGGPRPSHWDLLLEDGPVLKTWALRQWPTEDDEVRAEPLPDHRLLYLDYEGPITGNRGEVARWDQGEFTWESKDARQWRVHLRGQRLIGWLTLTQDEPSTHCWSARFCSE